jgi:hypothetical protein
VGIEHTPKEAVDNSSVQPRKPGLRPDNPGSPDQPSRLQSLARAREPAQSQNADEEQAGAVSKDRPAEQGLLAGGAENDDLSAWIAAAEQLLGKPEPTAADGEDSANDTEEKVEVVADRLDFPGNFKERIEYGRPQGMNDDGTRYELPLFEGAPKREDARQGALGDCGVIAAMGAVAGTVPDKIQDSVKENSDGTVTVSLFETKFKDEDTTVPTGRVIEVRMTKDVPVFANDPHEAAFARGASVGVAWPGYVEKALGAVDETWSPDRGRHPVIGKVAERGYARLDKGTGAWTQAEILTQLTGRSARVNRLGVDAGSAPANEEILADLVESGQPALVSTLPDSMQLADPDVYKLSRQHVYELIGVEDGKAVLRNPYGHLHPKPVPIAEFTNHFNSYYAALEGKSGG